MKPVSVPQRGIYVAFCAAKPSGGVKVLRMAEWPTLILHSYRAPPLTMNAARSVASTLMEYGAPEVGNQPTQICPDPQPNPQRRVSAMLNTVMVFAVPTWSAPMHHKLLNATSTSQSATWRPMG